MKRVTMLWLGVIILTNNCLIFPEDNTIDFQYTVHAEKQNAMPIYVGIIGNNKKLSKVIDTIVSDLSFTHQCVITHKQLDKKPSKRNIKSLVKEGFALAIYITLSEDNNSFDWRLYNTFTAELIIGKHTKKSRKKILPMLSYQSLQKYVSRLRKLAT